MGIEVKITKTVIKAAPRLLKATWSCVPQAQTPMTQDARDRIIANAEKKWFLQCHGTRVDVYASPLSTVRQWCEDNLHSQWEWSDYDTLSSPLSFEREMKRADEGLCDDDIEVMWVRALARQMDQDAALEEGRTLPSGFFWIEDINEALLFKLTWGGR